MGLLFDIDFGDGFSEKKATYGKISDCKFVESNDTIVAKLLCFATKEDREKGVRTVQTAWINLGSIKDTLLPLLYPKVIELYPKLSDATKYIDVESVELSDTEDELYIGESKLLTYSIFPETANYKEVIWASSNESVATVVDGLITAISDGESTITAIAEYGRCKSTCKVTVKKSESEDIEDSEDEEGSEESSTSDEESTGE